MREVLDNLPFARVVYISFLKLIIRSSAGRQVGREQKTGKKNFLKIKHLLKIPKRKEKLKSTKTIQTEKNVKSYVNKVPEREHEVIAREKEWIDECRWLDSIYLKLGERNEYFKRSQFLINISLYTLRVCFPKVFNKRSNNHLKKHLRSRLH